MDWIYPCVAVRVERRDYHVVDVCRDHQTQVSVSSPTIDGIDRGGIVLDGFSELLEVGVSG